MFQPKSLASPTSLIRCKSFSTAIIAFASVIVASCGSSHNMSQNVSPAQAQAISHEVVTALEGALGSVSSGLPASAAEKPKLPALLRSPMPAQSSDCTTNSSGTTCNIPVSFSGPCPGGGTIGVTGNFDFTLNSSGNGSDSTSLTVTPTNCSVSNLTINGDPNIKVATQFNIASDQLQFPVTITESGGVTYGPNPSGSCSVNTSLTINSPTSCTVTGMVCGQSISGSC